jgi:hypothetical protein
VLSDLVSSSFSQLGNNLESDVDAITRLVEDGKSDSEDESDEEDYNDDTWKIFIRPVGDTSDGVQLGNGNLVIFKVCHL